MLHELRNDDRTAVLKEYAKFDGSLSERDHLAIRKTFSGMMKLIYPDGKMTDEEAYELIDFAAESRKRVKDQLYVIDETFKAEPAKFEYINVKTGATKVVKTLEQIENDFLPEHEREAMPEEEPENELPTEELGGEPSETPAETPRGKRLASKYIEIRANQKNVSYERLFGDYFETAQHIVITDPYIRQGFQIDNLIELIQTIRDCCLSEEISIELHTQNNDDSIPEMIDTFDDLAAELENYGVEFTYAFDADHDRFIKLDNGWKILLSRGLDIFDKYSRFSMSNKRQENRRCREFSVTFIQE